ncbi:lysis system i-spanin subunit Rz [Symbiopectobacterium sp.]|uniref:lysis system i-spanin subunit Rz n=1 Tax=Symbiopectobacterium sp. TaxID=2952789 RepID=UPI003F410772
MHWKISLVIAALLASMTGAALSYRALYLDTEKDRQYLEAQTQSQQAALERLNNQMQTVAALDTKHTRELEHDKKRIAQLERDVADGRRRLQVRAVCPPECPPAAPPPAWIMQPAPDLITPLSEIISLSDDESKSQKRK